MEEKKAAGAATGDGAKITKEREYFTFYRSFFDAINLCNDRDKRLTMYEAILNYAFNKTEPEFCEDAALQYFWIGVLPILQKSWKKFESGCLGGAPEGNTNNKGKGKVNRKSTESQANNEKQISNIETTNKEQLITRASKEFNPPELEDVLSYYSSIHGTEIDSIIATKFINYFAARGWKMGKVMMADWRPAFETWCIREQQEFKHKYTDNNGNDKSATEQRDAELGQLQGQLNRETGNSGEIASLDDAVW